MTGAIPGTPVMTPQGVAGRVLRAGPSSATVLLLVDPGSRIAVISQESAFRAYSWAEAPTSRWRCVSCRITM
ncbi:MAG: rod shape-determining protein MreC [Bilophila wadsworthia]